MKKNNVYKFIQFFLTKYLLAPCVFHALMKNNLVGCCVPIDWNTHCSTPWTWGNNYIVLNGKKKTSLMGNIPIETSLKWK